MTEKELKTIESILEKRGYRKLTRGLTANEMYGWFKTIDWDKDGYLMEFRVWKCVVPYSCPVEHYIGFDFYSTISGLPTYAEFEMGWEPIADINTFERMAAEFNQMVRKFVNSEKEER